MRTTTNGGLVLIAGVGTDAANEEPAADRVVPVEKKREDSSAGWNPYEVWRTRVKEPRVTRDELPVAKPHDRG